MTVEVEDDFVIPELEKKAATETPLTLWTPFEDRVLMKYYGKVRNSSMSEYFRGRGVHRSIAAIEHRARHLGLTRK